MLDTMIKDLDARFGKQTINGRQHAKQLSKILLERMRRNGLRVMEGWQGDDLPSEAVAPNAKTVVNKYGTTFYVFEPHYVDAGVIQVLAGYAANGWEITITGESPYFPGSTICVVIWRGGKKQGYIF